MRGNELEKDVKACLYGGNEKDAAELEPYLSRARAFRDVL